jgi:FkbH-like protein
MDCFEYPINAKELLRKKRILKKELLENGGQWIEKNVAILGGSTTSEVADQLELFLLHNGIKAKIYQSEYGQYWQDAVFGNSALDEFAPDIVYIHTNWRNIESFPEITDSREQAEAKLDAEYGRFVAMWEKLEERYSCVIIQNNFDRPDYRLMGNRDIWDYRGRSNFISCLNQKFYGYAQDNENFYINDLEYTSQEYGLAEWGNPLYWYMYHYAMCVDAIPYIAKSVADIIKSVYGRNKKVLMLDLDNTLWGGVVGDDGVSGIEIGNDTPKGQAYAEFQKYCKKLKDIGVVLTVNSKNDLENALDGLKHPDCVLGAQDFVTIKANWNNKDENAREIANELSLGADSFVFADDNPVERDIVSSQMPEVAVVKMESVEKYISVLDGSGYFETTALSAEDLKKTEMYHAKAEAVRAAATYADYNEYLDSLEMKAYIDEFKPMFTSRIAQLTNKSNQFNLTTLRCTQEDITAMQESPDYVCLCARLTDRFADNGLVTVVAANQSGDTLHVKLWLMSCRVLKRGVEDTMMNVLVEQAQSRNVSRIVGYYYPTAKNGMVKEFYGQMGFEKVSEDADGNTMWELDVRKYVRREVHIEV